MSKNQNKFKDTLVFKLLIVVILAWIILAIIFGIYDLEISKAIVNRESIWANFMYTYDEGLGYGLVSVAIAILVGSYQDDLKKQKIPAYVIIIIGLIIFIIALIVGIVWFMVFGGGIALTVLIFLIVAFKKDLKEFKTLAIVILLLVIINPLLFGRITKFLTGRVRFKYLASDYSNYTPWFSPPGPSTEPGHDSFPSGHTALGWCFLPLLILVKDREWKDPIRIIFTIIIGLYGFLVTLSTIIIGAHYASDTLFSTGMAAVITILLYKIFYLDKE